MKLLSEGVNSKVELLTENTASGKKYYIEGIFAQADVVNGNNRIYPSDVLIKETKRYISDVVKNNQAYGELDHPDSPSINLQKASHIITELRIEGNNVIGKARLLDTPMGKIAQQLLEGGGRLGVSTRGLASTSYNESGQMIIEDDFQLCAIDIVATPSAPDAYVNGVLESKIWVKENGMYVAKENLEQKRKILALKNILKSFNK